MMYFFPPHTMHLTFFPPRSLVKPRQSGRPQPLQTVETAAVEFAHRFSPRIAPGWPVRNIKFAWDPEGVQEYGRPRYLEPEASYNII